MDEELDVQFIEGITADVLRVLRQEKFFERLDDLLCPMDSSILHAVCNHSYDLTTAILKESGHDEDATEDVRQVMHHNGGHCDCEILYNVAEESRLKSKYWIGKSAQLGSSEESGQVFDSGGGE